MSLIQIRNVDKQYKNGVTAAYNLNLEIDKGDFVFLIGSSGSGKSTLLKMLYREEKPTNGDIIIGGINVAELRNSKVYKIRRKIGVVFQDFKLLYKLTVFENIAFALEILGLDKKEIQEKTLNALTLVGLKHKAKEFPGNLSGGEQQRVAIARAIVNNPRILLCDEPTGNLDPDTSMEVMKVVEEINKLGTTIIMGTHDRDIVNRLKKRVIVMNDGKLEKDYEKGTFKYEANSTAR